MAVKRLLAVGDIHGEWQKFQSMYEKVGFNPEEDLMVFLGDYLDRGSEPVPVMEFVLSHQDTENMIFLRGNHEQMFFDSFRCAPDKAMGFGEWFDSPKRLWFDNGGSITFNRIKKSGRMYELNRTWLDWIDKLPLYADIVVGEQHYWFMHADCNPTIPLDQQETSTLLWGRSLAAHPELNDGANIIVLGHTPVQALGYPAEPQWLDDGKVVLVDTGSFLKNGHISCVDLLSHTVYPSD